VDTVAAEPPVVSGLLQLLLQLLQMLVECSEFAPPNESVLTNTLTEFTECLNN
jgi:hypothetical protein